MKKDFVFHYKYKGRRREYHIIAETYNEAKELFDQYVMFLSYMKIDNVEDISGKY